MRKLLVVLGAVIVLGGGAAWLAFHYLDAIVKVAIGHYGPQVLGVDVDVGDVDISTRDGRGAIRRLEIGNPAGFASARAASFGEVRLALDPATVTSGVVHVREIAIDAPRITYERGAKASNLDVIQNHIEAYAKRDAAPAKGGAAEPRSAKRRFVIDRLAIRGGRVHMTNAKLAGQGLGFDLPDIVLRDVGRREGGVTAAEAAAIVAAAVQNRIAQKLLTNIDALRRGGVEGAVDALRELIRRP